MDTTKIGKVLRWKNGQYEGSPRPQGTWNLYWCSHRGSHMWCDCKMKDAWKNSTVSNPKYYNGLVLREFPANPCGCHVTHGYTGSCILANYGEMESVTCNLCTPQDQHWTCA